jgi:hypothetical protein
MGLLMGFLVWASGVRIRMEGQFLINSGAMAGAEGMANLWISLCSLAQMEVGEATTEAL